MTSAPNSSLPVSDGGGGTGIKDRSIRSQRPPAADRAPRRGSSRSLRTVRPHRRIRALRSTVSRLHAFGQGLAERHALRYRPTFERASVGARLGHHSIDGGDVAFDLDGQPAGILPTVEARRIPRSNRDRSAV